MMAICESACTTKHVTVIGISGASCSGKTGLARELSQEFKHSVVIHQDDYYLEFNQVPKSEDHPEVPLWDVPDAIDCVKLVQVIRDTVTCNVGSSCTTCQSQQSQLSESQNKQSPHHLVIIEGTMILSLREVRELLDILFFITLDYNTIKTRRSIRDYGEHKDPPGYLEQHVWPCYLRELEVLNSLCNDSLLITVLDGLEERRKHLSIVKDGVQRNFAWC